MEAMDGVLLLLYEAGRNGCHGCPAPFETGLVNPALQDCMPFAHPTPCAAAHAAAQDTTNFDKLWTDQPPVDSPCATPRDGPARLSDAASAGHDFFRGFTCGCLTAACCCLVFEPCLLHFVVNIKVFHPYICAWSGMGMLHASKKLWTVPRVMHMRLAS
jgi:hypothetical protein